MQDDEGTREEADGLVSKSLLQDVGGGGYRMHDLVLGFMKIKIKADGEKTLGPDHPNLATRLNNRAVVLQAQVRVARKFQERSSGAR